MTLTFLGATISRPAHAGPDTKTMLVSAGYGTLAGAALGLISWPFTGEAKGVLIGAGVGLVLGLVVGVFHVTHRGDPDNPLSKPQAPDLPSIPRMPSLPSLPGAGLAGPHLDLALGSTRGWDAQWAQLTGNAAQLQFSVMQF